MLHPTLLGKGNNGLRHAIAVGQNFKISNDEIKLWQGTEYLGFWTDETGWPLSTQSIARLRSLEMV